MGMPGRSKEYKALAAVLVACRREAGLTQSELAARLKKPQSWVAKVELGGRRLDVVELFAVARALKIEPLRLIERWVNW